MTKRRKVRHVFAGLVVAGLMLGGRLAYAQPACGYEVVIVHPDPCGIFGPPSASGQGINSCGHVVGHRVKCSDQLDQAFLWTLQRGMVDLEMPEDATASEALDVNDNGWSVGWVSISGDELGSLGFVHDGNVAITLGTLPGGNYSEATAINSGGQVAGFWGDFVKGDPASEAFIWENGRMIGLGEDLNTVNSKALAINDTGQITGWMGLSVILGSHAFIWDSGKVIELPFIPGGFTSAGFDISDDGAVAGWGKKFDEILEEDVRHAFLWTDGKMIDLGVLPGDTESFAYGVNVARQVVGLSWDFGSSSAPFIWENGVMTDLNDLVPPEFDIDSAWAINNAGEIAGSGKGKEGGFPGMALLIPKPRPLGDLDMDCVVGAPDLLLLLSSWGPCEGCDADLDGNGSVGASDLLILLVNWG